MANSVYYENLCHRYVLHTYNSDPLETSKINIVQISWNFLWLCGTKRKVLPKQFQEKYFWDTLTYTSTMRAYIYIQSLNNFLYIDSVQSIQDW